MLTVGFMPPKTRHIINLIENMSAYFGIVPDITISDHVAMDAMDAPRCCRTHLLELRAQSSSALSAEEVLELAQLHANSDGDAWMILVGLGLRWLILNHLRIIYHIYICIYIYHIYFISYLFISNHLPKGHRELCPAHLLENVWTCGCAFFCFLDILCTSSQQT